MTTATFPNRTLLPVVIDDEYIAAVNSAAPGAAGCQKGTLRRRVIR